MNRFAAIALLGTLATCDRAAMQSRAAHRGPLGQVVATNELVGTWRWILKTSDAETDHVEEERWYFQRTANPNELVGRYARDVEIRARDGLPFRCNQRPWYRQRAVFDVHAMLDPATLKFQIVETGYRTEPGPCDHGFRKLGAYTGTFLGGERLELAFAGGTQTLWHTDDAPPALPEPAWPAQPSLFGAWRWDATSYDDDGNLRDETEWWELTRRTETRVDATYRRRVTVRSPDGKPIACANGPLWRFDDAYVLEGQREEEHWRFTELAVEPGVHPCMATSQRRNLDEMTAEQIGDYLLLEWRGKRRQVLHRPADDLR